MGIWGRRRAAVAAVVAVSVSLMSPAGSARADDPLPGLLPGSGTPASPLFMTEFHYPAPGGTGDLSPNAVAIGPHGTVYVGTWNGAIIEVDPDGTLLRTVVDLHQAEYGITVAADGSVYALTSGASGFSLTKVTDGAVVWSIPVAGFGDDVEVSGDTLWMTTGGSAPNPGTLTKLSTSGSVLLSTPLPDGQSAYNLSILPDGNPILPLSGQGATEFGQDGTPAGPALGDFNDRIYATNDGDLYGNSWDGSNEALRKRSPDGTIDSTDPAFQDGNAFAVANDGTVWTAGNGDGLVRLDPDPHPVLTSSADANGGLASTGDDVSFDASTTQIAFSHATHYAWDLDGDGTFETDTGAGPTVQTTFATAGVRTIGVRVTAATGRTASAQATVDVRTASADGPAGVSINHGATYTRNPVVTLTPRWPQYATTMLISNDGGFGGATPRNVASPVSWRLDSSTAERMPKTVYITYSGGTASTDVTYQDDIILDTTRPTVDSADDQGLAVPATRTLRASRYVRLSIRAHDGTSGLAAVQVASDRTAPRAWLKYSRTVTTRWARVLYVRVRDRAGNVSRWRRVL